MKYDKFNLKFLGSILAGAIQFLGKKTQGNNVMSYKTTKIICIFYMQIGDHTSAKKSNF